MIAFEAVVTI